MEEKEFDIIIYGAGAIGATIGGLLSKNYKKVYLIARGEHAKKMSTDGLKLYEMDPNKMETIQVKVLKDISEKPEADIVIITVKNFDLENAAKDIHTKLGDKPIIISLQNGTENQFVLPKYFKKVVYGVLWFGAWLDRPGIIGTEKIHPITLGILNGDSELERIVNFIINLMNKAGIQAELVPNFQDAVHSKIIFNITNALLTLIGHGFREILNVSILRKITVNLLVEGIKIVQAAGYHEFIRGENHPTWKLLKIARHLPGFITDKIFLGFINNVNLNSMAQDVITIKRNDTELESLNGYLLELAKKNKINTPYNLGLYDACKENFSESKFRPMTEDELWFKIKDTIKSSKRKT